MAIGMTYEQYWFDDPLMVRAFYKAEKLRQQKTNNEAWLYGAYVLRALDATVGNMFRQKGAKASEYPKQPIELDNTTVKQKKIEPDEDQEIVFAKAYMSSMIFAGKNWKK